MLTDHTNTHDIINNFILYWEIVKGTYMLQIDELKNQLLFRKWRSHKTLKNFRRLSSNCILFVFTVIK